MMSLAIVAFLSIPTFLLLASQMRMSQAQRLVVVRQSRQRAPGSISAG